MNYQYSYTLNQFPNQKADLDSLTLEIQASSILAVLDYINESETNVDIFFQTALSAPEIVTLNGIVAVHQGNPPASNYDVIARNDVSIYGFLRVDKAIRTDTDLKAGKDVQAQGNALIDVDIIAGGDASIGGTLKVGKNANIGNILKVAGAAYFNYFDGIGSNKMLIVDNDGSIGCQTIPSGGSPQVSSVISNGAITTGSTTDVSMAGMVLTGVLAGTYLLNFGTSLTHSTTGSIDTQIYVNNASVNSSFQRFQRGTQVVASTHNYAGFPLTVSSNGSAITIRWRTTGATATSTNRYMSIFKIT